MTEQANTSVAKDEVRESLIARIEQLELRLKWSQEFIENQFPEEVQNFLDMKNKQLYEIRNIEFKIKEMQHLKTRLEQKYKN